MQLSRGCGHAQLPASLGEVLRNDARSNVFNLIANLPECPSRGMGTGSPLPLAADCLGACLGMTIRRLHGAALASKLVADEELGAYDPGPHPTDSGCSREGVSLLHGVRTD
jgi:hypothetical protein